MAPPRREKKPRPRLGDPSKPRSMGALADRFLEALAVRHFAENTVNRHHENVGRFIAWCEERGIERPDDVTKRIVERYQRHVFYYKQKSGKPLAASTQHARLIAVRVF